MERILLEITIKDDTQEPEAMSIRINGHDYDLKVFGGNQIIPANNIPESDVALVFTLAKEALKVRDESPLKRAKIA